MNFRRLMGLPLLPRAGRPEPTTFGGPVVHHSKFGSQCLSWVIFVGRDRVPGPVYVRSAALLLHRTTPPVDLESVRARTAALLGPLFRFDFGKKTPGPDFQKTVKPPRVRFDFALKRATWRTERSALIPAYPCHHVVK